MHVKKDPPFTKARQLIADDKDDDSDIGNQHVPGWPDVELSNTSAVIELLQRELWADDLEKQAQHLWTLTTPSSTNISSLHQQKVESREIVVTEDPRLHLVWSSRRIFIKPIPDFMLSHTFWDEFLTVPIPVDGSDGLDVRKAALGFLRSYRYLIRHKSDLVVAQHPELQLVPDHIKWKDMSLFLSEISRNIDERDLSGRYNYGELRLSRLNLYARMLFGRSHYIHMPVQYGEYFTKLFGPVLLVFAVASIMLNTMQVALASRDPAQIPVTEQQAFYWFSIVALIGIVAVVVALAGVWLWKIVKEWNYAIRKQQEKRRMKRLGF